MQQTGCGDLAGEDIAAALGTLDDLGALDDLDELARAWGGYDVTMTEDRTWHAAPRDGGAPVTAGTAAGLWLALWDARDRRRAS